MGLGEQADGKSKRGNGYHQFLKKRKHRLERRKAKKNPDSEDGKNFDYPEGSKTKEQRIAAMIYGAEMMKRERDEAREALIPFICLNPKSQRVKKKWEGFVQAAKKVLEAAK